MKSVRTTNGHNTRFLLLPRPSVPSLGTKVLSLVRDRIAADWEERYGHAVEVLETFVDPAQFCGTVYTAAVWIELGQTQGGDAGGVNTM